MPRKFKGADLVVVITHQFHRIMFMREFRVIDAARSEDQLRLRLKHNEFEDYGEAFIPEFAYEVIRQLPRFRDMRVSPFSTSFHATVS
jgi:hypothetical protein